MFTNLGKQKSLIFFGVLASLVVLIVILVCCLDFNGGPSTGAEVLASVPFVVGKSGWSQVLRNESDVINVAGREPWDLQGLTASAVNAQLYTVGASSCSQNQPTDNVVQTLEQIDAMIRVFEKYDTYFTPAVKTADIYSARFGSKIAGFLAVDGGYALDSSFSILRDYYRLGVRSVALGGQCSPPWSSSVDASNRSIGLSSFGQEIITEMNKLGIMIDLTGSNEETQLQTITLSRAPVIFTSSSCKNITDVPLNVADDVLRALGSSGGLVMISFKANQCCSDLNNCTVDTVVEHINHAANIAGKSSVGIGGDVGMPVGYPEGLENSSGYTAVFDRLLSGGQWTVEELQNLAGNNFIRVMDNVEQVARSMKQEGALPGESGLINGSTPNSDQGRHLEFKRQLMIERSLPFRNSLVNFQHRMLSFQETETVTTTPSTATTADENTNPTTASTTTTAEGSTTPTSTSTNTTAEGSITPTSTSTSTTAEGSITPTSTSTSTTAGGSTTPTSTNANTTAEGSTTPTSSSTTATGGENVATTQKPSSGVVHTYLKCLSIIVPILISSRNAICTRVFR